jgi:hypothetical protein
MAPTEDVAAFLSKVKLDGEYGEVIPSDEYLLERFRSKFGQQIGQKGTRMLVSSDEGAA